jgi:CubicO group peptidase (beta-lactamase class C family)
MFFPKPREMILSALMLALSITVVGSGCDRQSSPGSRSEVQVLADLERDLEDLRSRLRIPGMSAAIAKDGQIIWARGFGRADRERGVAAKPDSVVHLASLTKPYASTVILQLVEEGLLGLDDPVSKFGVEMVNADSVRVWHLLSHTSSGEPGTRYEYDGGAFAELGQVIETATGRSFAAELTDRIIRPLQLRHTAPNPEEEAAFAHSGLDRERIERRLMSGYARAWGRRIWPTGLFGPLRPIEHPTSFHAAAGLVASAVDVARFSIALDQGRLLGDAMRERAMRPVVTPSGETVPYGLGWFVQEHEGEMLVWHFPRVRSFVTAGEANRRQQSETRARTPLRRQDDCEV